MKQKLLSKVMLLLFALVAGSTSVWADGQATITIGSFTDLPSKQAYNTYSWTADGISGKATIYGSTSATNMQFNASNYLFYSTTAITGRITSIKLTTASGTNRTYEVYGSTVAYTGSGTSYGTKIGSQTVTTSGTSYNVTSGDYTYFTIVKMGSGAGYLSEIVISYEDVDDSSVATPSISGEDNFYPSTEVSITCATDGAAIQYTTDNGSNWNDYSAPFTITETTTIQAKATKSGLEDSETTDAVTFTKANVMNVAEAITAIDDADKGTVSNVYVSGTISQIDSYNSSKYITYWISDDGTTTNQLEVYNGLGIDGAAFSAISDLQLGDEVIIKGDITYYSKNSVYEFAANNQLVSLYRQPTISADDVDIAADVLAGNITYSITNPDGSTLTAARKSGDWLTVGAVDSENSKVAFTATENTGAAREAVVTLTYGSVTKDVAITQGAAVAKYAVTFSAPSNGTLVVKRDEVAVSSGTELSDGTVLTIVTTADDGYRLVKWEYNEDNEGWNDGVGDSYTINGKPVAFRASFKEIVYHTITYSVNGVKTTDEVEDGEAVSFAAPESGVPAGYAFKGWSTSEILTPQNSAPDYVSSATSSANVTYYAVLAKVVGSVEESWTETALEDLTSSDVFVIVGYNNIKYYGMTNDKGTGSAPSASNVTVSGSTLTGTIADEIKWNISGNSTDGYTFYPNGSTTTWLYCISQNNGLRVGTGEAKNFNVTDGYLYNSGQKRYVGVYGGSDWRSYTSINSNIENQTFKYFKHIPASTVYGDYCTLVPYTRDVTADNWGTLCLPYNANVEGATLYTFEGVDNTTTPTTAYFEEAANVEGGKPYFFKATGTTLTATYTSSSAQAASSVNGAVGTLENISVTEGMYLLSNGQLVKCGTGCTLAANRAYIDMSEASVYGGGGAVKMQFDVTDGVATLRDGETMDEVFDLSGRRVVKPTKGLYIVNGKKIMVK